MNSLNWMIYLADVASGLNAVSFFGTMICLIGTGMSFGLAHFEDLSDAKPWISRFAYASVIFLLLAVFLPSKDTIYAIAASETGEQILKTPEASKARQALNAWLDKQIGNTQPEKGK